MTMKSEVRELTAAEVEDVAGGPIILAALFAAPVVKFAAGVIVGGAAVGLGIYLAEQD